MAIIANDEKVFMVSNSTNTTYSGSASLKAMNQWYTMQDVKDTVGVAAEGPQGVPGVQGEQGIPGTAGAVGPAGLTWRSTWVSGTSYIANDAVSYNGASWFCILATSGTTNPSADATHWALLASQGAQGVQGIQGIQGLQGIQGIQGPPAAQNLQQTVDLGNGINTGIVINNGTYDFELSSGSAIIAQLSTGQEAGFYHDKFSFFKDGYSTQLKPYGTVTADRNILLPNASGTVALTSDVTLQGSYNGGNTIVDSGFKIGFFDLASGITIEDTSTLDKVTIETDVIRLAKNSSGVKSTNLRQAVTPTANRNIYFPDADGTIALTNYKSYIAKITHGEGNAAPTAVVLENTIGTVTWNYDEPFNYFLSSSGLFTLNKTVVFATSPTYPLMKVGVSANNANFVGLTTDVDGFANLMFEIRVYN